MTCLGKVAELDPAASLPVLVRTEGALEVCEHGVHLGVALVGPVVQAAELHLYLPVLALAREVHVHGELAHVHRLVHRAGLLLLDPMPTCRVVGIQGAPQLLLRLAARVDQGRQVSEVRLSSP